MKLSPLLLVVLAGCAGIDFTVAPVPADDAASSLSDAEVDVRFGDRLDAPATEADAVDAAAPVDSGPLETAADGGSLETVVDGGLLETAVDAGLEAANDSALDTRIDSPFDSALDSLLDTPEAPHVCVDPSLVDDALSPGGTLSPCWAGTWAGVGLASPLGAFPAGVAPSSPHYPASDAVGRRITGSVGACCSTSYAAIRFSSPVDVSARARLTIHLFVVSTPTTTQRIHLLTVSSGAAPVDQGAVDLPLTSPAHGAWGSLTWALQGDVAHLEEIRFAFEPGTFDANLGTVTLTPL